jgi:hypothetical protein
VSRNRCARRFPLGRIYPGWRLPTAAVSIELD